MKNLFVWLIVLIVPMAAYGQIKINSPYQKKKDDGTYIPDSNDNSRSTTPATNNPAADLSGEEAAVAQVIKNLFQAMNRSDAAAIKRYFAPEGRLNSVEANGNLTSLTVDQFSKMIGESARGSLEERMNDLEIRIDDRLATAWVEYDFFFNNQLHHCGVDAFQLGKSNYGWRIIQITDTQRENCVAGGKAGRINQLLDGWHMAAAKNNASEYFDLMADNGVYLGTDPTENWTKDEFYRFTKPFFDKGQGFDFKPRDRKVEFSKEGDVAWFSELLDTWMGTCRGTGIMEKHSDGKWKMRQYNLAITVPNDLVRDYVNLANNKRR